MAYIPPHKRISRDEEEEPSPTPYVYGQRHLKRVLQVGDRDPISKWFIVPSLDANHDDDPCSVPLKLIELEDWENLFFFERKDDQIDSIEQRSGLKPFILVCRYLPKIELDKPNIEVNEIVNNFAKSPWISILKEIQKDVLASFQNLRSEMCCDGFELIKPSFVVKFGINHLHSLDDIQRSSVKSCLGQSFRGFHTNFDVEPILDDVIPKLGVDFYMEKEYYHVKVFDKYRKHANITCKCSINKENGELDICKVELNQVRHLIVDISYLDKDLDQRLMLSSKWIVNTLADDEKQCLRKLIKSAILDPEMKGGLRWPLEMESLDNRYGVIGVLHTKSKSSINSSMRLKSTLVDRFNFRNCSGEVHEEVTLEMTEIDMKLKDATMEPGSITGMVDDTLKLLWEHFP